MAFLSNAESAGAGESFKSKDEIIKDILDFCSPRNLFHWIYCPSEGKCDFDIMLIRTLTREVQITKGSITSPFTKLDQQKIQEVYLVSVLEHEKKEDGKPPIQLGWPKNHLLVKSLKDFIQQFKKVSED